MADQKQNMLAMLLQKFISPNSTTGKLASQDAYQKHVIDAQTNGQQPMTFEQFQAQQPRS